MILINPWVGYLDRSYQQIKNSIISRIAQNVTEITDLSESNPLIIIVGMFAGIAEMLNYYIDNMAREAFIETAQRYTSLVKLVKLLDYRIKTRLPANVDIELKFLDNSNNPATSTLATTLPAGLVFKTSNNLKFRSRVPITVAAGLTQITIPVSQLEVVPSYALGLSDGNPNQKVLVGDKVVYKSITLLINSEIWEEQDTFAFSNPASRHFIVDIDVDGLAYIIFGDGVFGKIPLAGQPIIGSLLLSEGSDANTISPNTINVIESTISIPGVAALTATNPLMPNGGSGYESFELLRRRAPLWVRTLNRMVNYSDHNDLPILHPSVKFARASFCCTDGCVSIYIAPVGGGIASLSTIQAVQDFLDCHKMITIKICTKPAGITPLNLVLKVKPRFGQDSSITQQDVESALLNWGSYDNSNINKTIAYSDILALVDNLQRVENAEITLLKTTPYARPQSHYTPLNWISGVLNSTTRREWLLQYTGLGTFKVIRDGVYLGTFPMGVNISFPEIEFIINSGPYSAGMGWKFITYPINQTHLIDDFTVPVLLLQNLLVEVEQNTGANCNTGCNH